MGMGGGQKCAGWRGLAVAVWPSAQGRCRLLHMRARRTGAPQPGVVPAAGAGWLEVERRVCSHSGFGGGVRAGWVRDGGEVGLRTTQR